MFGPGCLAEARNVALAGLPIVELVRQFVMDDLLSDFKAHILRTEANVAWCRSRLVRALERPNMMVHRGHALSGGANGDEEREGCKGIESGTAVVHRGYRAVALRPIIRGRTAE